MQRPFHIIATVLVGLAVAGGGALRAAVVDYVQASDPLGLIADTTAPVETGTDQWTVSAPRKFSSYAFTHWTLNGTPQRDLLGRAINPVSFIILGPTQAIAHYVPSGEDTDTDSLLDWYELEFYGDLDETPEVDNDGDAFQLAEEYRRDTHPEIRDELTDGGFTFVTSPAVGVIVNQDYAWYSKYSNPEGLVASSKTVVAKNSTLSLSDTYGANGGYRFTHWTVNGNRQADVTGRAYGGLSFIFTDTTEAIAEFIAQNTDSDSDGILDWYELNFFGNLDHAANSDSDGDGLDLAEEYRRDTHPSIPDDLADGGFSLVVSPPTGVIVNQDYAWYRQFSTPEGLVSSATSVIQKGTDLTLTDTYGSNAGYQFAYWMLNGERQADVIDRAYAGLTFTFADATDAEAVFVPTSADTDADGLLDWYEYNLAGDLARSPESDTDGDELPLAEEYRRDTHPGIVDEFTDGGFALVTSPPVTVIISQDYAWHRRYSNPEGLVTTVNAPTAKGTEISVSDTYGSTEGYRFAQWTHNGERQADVAGRALGGWSFTLQAEALLEALFIPQSQDSDGDALLDWYELNMYGDLDEKAASDTDEDGLDLAEEYRRDTHPNLPDEIVDGGFTVVTSSPVRVDFQFFPRIQHALVGGFHEQFFATPDTVPGTFDIGTASAPALGDWDGDGDLDLFVGGAAGALRVFENRGSPVTMDLVEIAGFRLEIGDLPEGRVCPALGDWNGDGLADLAIGGDDGVIRLYASDGTFGSESLGDAVLLDTGQSSLVMPAFLDADADGWVDLLVLLPDGTVRLYSRTGDAVAPYDPATFTDNFLGTTVPDASGISVADITGDEFPDVLISDSTGRVWEFHSTGTGSFALHSTIFGGTFAGFATDFAAAAGDMDGDGDTDMIGGSANGGLAYLRNPEVHVQVIPHVQTTSVDEHIQFAIRGVAGTLTWSMVSNPSGGTIDPLSGLYTAGSNGGVDGIAVETESGLRGQAWINVIESTQVDAAGKAIVVAGRRSTYDPIWPATSYLTDHAYDTLRYRGLSPENIHYLSHVPSPRVDAPTTRENLQWALTGENVVSTSDPSLWLCLTDHGRLIDDGADGEFVLSETESVSGSDLHAWLDAFEGSHPLCEVTVVLECCYAGALAAALTDGYTGTRRAVIASSGAGQLAHFISTGLISFSQTLWSDIALGMTVQDSFADAHDAMSTFQQAESLNTGLDQDRPVGPDFIAGADRPQVGEVSPDQELAGAATAVLWAKQVSGPVAIQRVWGVVIPPGYSASGDAPVVDLPEVEFRWDSGLLQWQAEYGGFTEGNAENPYTVLIYARDIWGSVSYPMETHVAQTGVRERAIVFAAGAATRDQAPAIRRLADMAWHTFRRRRIQPADIRYLAADSELAVADAPATIAAMEQALLTWSPGEGSLNALTVYLVGVGSAQGLVCANSDVLTPALLRGWLDTLQTNTGCRVTLVVEGDYSGKFLKDAQNPAHARIILTSTQEQKLSVFGSDGWTSFSHWFWSGIARGGSVRQAFASALTVTRALHLPMVCQLDDNGDGVYVKKHDGVIAQTVYVGTAFVTGDDPPRIGACSAAQYVTAGGTARFWVGSVTMPEGGAPESVWADIVAPATDAPSRSAQQPVLLSWDSTSEHYQGAFSAFGAPGRYVAMVYAGSPADVSQVSEPVPIEIYYDVPAPTRPDDTVAAAPLLPLDGSVQIHELSTAEPVVQVRVEAQAGQHLTFDVFGLAANQDASLALLSADGTELLAVDDWGQGFAERIWAWSPPVPGTYLIEVRWEGGRAVGSASLRGVVEQTAEGDEYEVDDTPELARFISFEDGAFQVHSFHEPGDEDWVVFFALAGISYAIEVFDEGANSDVVLELYASDGVTLVGEPMDETVGSGETIELTQPAAGVYYVRVRHADSTASGDGTDYKLKVFQTTGDAPAFVYGRVTDAAGNTIAGSSIIVSDGAEFVLGHGIYVKAVVSGTYTITASAPDYLSDSATVLVPSGTPTEVNFALASGLRSLTITSIYGDPQGAGDHALGSTVDWSVTSPWPDPDGDNWKRYVADPASGSVLMDQDRTVSVDWDIEWYLDLTVDTGGAVDTQPGWYADGAERTLTATPATTDYHFVQWTGTSAEDIVTDNLLTLSMDQARSLTATFALNPDADTDHDSLPDLWELAQFHDLDAQAGDGDPDHDGRLNAQEYADSSNPNVFTLGTGVGWNLISLSVTPDVADVAERFPSYGFGTVWEWGTGGYTAAQAIGPKRGYWVWGYDVPDRAGRIRLLDIPGTPEDTTIGLDPGWNLVGPARACPLPGDERILGNIWWWDTDLRCYRETEDGLRPGRGYWIFLHATQPVTIDLGE